MTGLLRKASLLAFVGVMAATSAMAAVPFPGNCVFPDAVNDSSRGITLLCRDAGAAITSAEVAAGPFRGGSRIIIKDAAGNPIPGSLVCINFTECYGFEFGSGVDPNNGTLDLKIGDAANQFGGMTADCVPAPGPEKYQGTVCGVTDGSGTVNMKVVGSASYNNVTLASPDGAGYCQSLACAHANPFNKRCGKVYADGVFISFVTVSSYDVAESNGKVTPSDITAVVKDNLKGSEPAATARYRERSDIDASGSVGPADITAVVRYAFVASLGAAQTYCTP